MPEKIKKIARNLNGPVRRRRVVVFFSKSLVIYLRIFLRGKIRGMLQKFTLGHRNAIQEHQHVRLSSLSIHVSFICFDFACIQNS